MRRNLILPTLFAVVVVSSLACPVLGQEVSVKEIWRSGIGDPVVAVALSQDGLYGAVTTEERVYLYDQNGTILWRYPVSHSRSVAISSDSERIVAGGDHLLLFDRKGNVIWRYKPESRIQGVAVAADGRTICAGAGTSLRVFSLDDGQTTANASWSFDTGGPVRSVSTDGDGSSIVAGGDSGNIYFFSGDGRLLWNYRTGSHGVRVAVSRDGSTVAAASIQRVTFLLNRNGRLLWKSPMPEMITDVSISGDGSTLFAGEREYLRFQSGWGGCVDVRDGGKDQVRLRFIRHNPYPRRYTRRNRMGIQGPTGNLSCRHIRDIIAGYRLHCRTAANFRFFRSGADTPAAGDGTLPGNAGYHGCVLCRAGIVAKTETVT